MRREQTALDNCLLDNGDIVANLTQADGSDLVWYDKGTAHYYLAARKPLTDGK